MRFPLRRSDRAALVSALLISCLSTTGLPPAFAQGVQSTAMASAVRPLESGKPGPAARFKAEDSGALAALDLQGKRLGRCPLRHTSVSARISGYVARVTVKQLFDNPFKDKIEAVYTFPLSDSAAVDEMLMKVGTRTIHGQIKRREEARQIYEEAKQRGNLASLLDQERPNIFTQSVANIKPGERVEITLNYVDLLPYEAGSFSFAFPTVVGPRFNPGAPTGKTGAGFSAYTTSVPDGSKITPPVTPEGTRSGHDISIDVAIDAGMPIASISSKLHAVTTTRPDANQASVSLKSLNTIPNKDFVLSWEVAGERLKSGYLAHGANDSGYFTLMIMPPKRVTPDKVAPKEMIFLIDCSGSQSGLPLEKAKETLSYILDHMNPQDTFQVIAFSNRLSMLFAEPQPADTAMREKARSFIAKLSADGGTWIAPAVEKACSIPADSHRLRIVTFMTDGYVGNDFEIMGMVRKLRGNSRWFPFGTGNSVNRLLIDGIAREGGGEAEYVLLNSPGSEVGRKFYNRISSPLLTDIKVDFDRLDVKEVFPHQISDVWAEKPLYITGRYAKPGQGVVKISGFAGGKPYEQKLAVRLPGNEPANAVLGPIWARAKVDRLMAEDWFGAQQGSVNRELKEEIIKVALDHHIMTQYTSFVAVEEAVITDGGRPRTVAVPVEMPDGLSYEGIFGADGAARLPGGRLAASRYCGNTVEAVGAGRMRFSAYPGGSPSPFAGGYGGAGEGVRGCLAKSPAPAPIPAPPPQEIAASVNSTVDQAPTMQRPRTDSLSQSLPARPADKEKSEAEKRQVRLSLKLDRSLRGLAEKLAQNGKDLRISGLQISDGWITIQVWLSDRSQEALDKLKAAGLKITFQATTAKMVIGRIEICKLDKLAELDCVERIEPPRTLH